MTSNYIPLKFAGLVTPYFIAIFIIVFLANVLNVSFYEIAILTAIGIVFGLFYLIVAYIGSQRKGVLLKFIVIVSVTSAPLALALQYIIQLAIKYSSIIIIFWVFVLAVAVGCTYEILKILLKIVNTSKESMSKCRNG